MVGLECCFYGFISLVEPEAAQAIMHKLASIFLIKRLDIRRGLPVSGIIEIKVRVGWQMLT